MRWHFTITSDMRDLGLKGNELLVFAVIYGYSANGEGCYYGSISYLAELVGVHYNTAQSILKDLTERGYLRKEELIIEGVKFCHYQAAKIGEGPQKLGTPSTKIGDNNKIDNKDISPRILKDTAPQGAVSQKDILRKFVALGCDESVLADWVAARKGAKVTASVLEGMQREADKAGISLAEAVRICAENSWRGFRADYLRKDHGTPAPKKQRSIMDGMKQVAASLWGTDPFGNPLPPDEIERRKRL